MAINGIGRFKIKQITIIKTSARLDDVLSKTRTMAFVVLGLSELVHMIGMSSNKMSFVQIMKKKNYFMVVVILISLILQVLVVQLPFANFANHKRPTQYI